MHEDPSQSDPLKPSAKEEHDRASDELTAEIMEVESPEGPLRRVRIRSLVALVLVVVILISGAIGLLVFGGPTSFGLGIVLCAMFLLAGFPVWASGMLRHGERRHAHEESEWLLKR